MKRSMKEIKKRHKKIIDLLNHQKKISILELSKLTHVSEMTTRRDCKLLASMGKITQERGSISLIAPEEIPLSDSVSHIKHCLGKEAANYIKDDDIVFINSSTTAFEAIPYLLNKNVRILTNNGYAGEIETAGKKGKIIFTGGEITRKMIMSGEMAASAFRAIRANAAIIGCAGISLKQGISTPFMEEARVNSTIIKQAQKLIVVADYSKFNTFSNFTVGHISDINLLITDTFVSNDVINKFLKAGVNVIQVPLN